MSFEGYRDRHKRGSGISRRDRDGPKIRPPPHLKGRAIGLFYRDLNRTKPKTPRLLEIPSELQRDIINTLQLFDSGNCVKNDGDFSDSFRQEYMDIISTCFMAKAEASLRSVTQCRNVYVEKWNEKLFEEHIQKQNDAQYKEMLKFRSRLPVYEKRNEILKCVKQNQVVVISGETGCGKTTQVGQLILEEACTNKRGAEVNIVMTQPRRIATTSIANRIASERAEPLGGSVGFTIRLESMVPRNYGSIEVVTNGVLLQRLQRDPVLSKVSHIILDEVHERDSICDISMAVVKQLLTLRKDLKVILMSATIDSARFCQYFGGCPQLHVPGLMFPVKEFYLEDALELTRFEKFPDLTDTYRSKTFMNFTRFGPKAEDRKMIQLEHKKNAYLKFIHPYIQTLKENEKYSPKVLELLKDDNCESLCCELIVALVRALMKKPDGAILIFVPGYSTISTMCRLLSESELPPHTLLPLHSRLNSLDQQAIFKKPPEGVRKIIVATNIAETSITIDDVVYVIDCGKMKLKDYVVERDMSTLKPDWITAANAHQRRGRAGRVQEGECWRLYTKIRMAEFSPRPSPEILRAPLHEPILTTLLLRLGPAPNFLSTLLDPPDQASVLNSINYLHRMRILDDCERLTPLGVHIARLPVHPGAARMLLLASLMSATGPATAIAAAIAFRDPFISPIGQESLVKKQRLHLSKGSGSDQIAAAEAQRIWENLPSGKARDFCYHNFLSWRTLEMLRDMRLQFGELLCSAKFLTSSNPDFRASNKNSNNYSLIKALIVAGLYPNVAIYRGKRALKLEDGVSVQIYPGSVNTIGVPPAARLVYFMKQESTKLFLHETSPAHALPLLFFGDRFKITEIPDSTDKVIVEIGGGSWTMSAITASLLERLRMALDSLLETKLVNPGPVDWDSSEGRLLTAIIMLITAEDNPESTREESLDSD